MMESREAKQRLRAERDAMIRAWQVKSDANCARAPKQPLWGHLKRLDARLEASWVGDLIGAISLFATFYVIFFIGGILQ